MQVARQCSPHIIVIDASLRSVVGPWCALGVSNWAKEEVSKKREEMYLAVYLQEGELMAQMLQASGMLCDLAKNKLNSGQTKHNST